MSRAFENGLALQTVGCLQSLCGLKWITEFGFVTIPTMALGAFVFLTALLLLSVAENRTAPPMRSRV